ncbi:MAG: hypothetical protein ACO1SV_18385 [Fimbriimonas sp.]
MKSFALLGAVLVLSPLAPAQAKPKPKPKPAAQKPATRPLLGTVQLPGDNGQLNVPYSMGNKGSELNFTLESAEFADRAHFADGATLANAEQKLLILTFAVQNPQKVESNLSWNSFKFTVVSPDDQNQDFGGYLYHPERKTRFDSTLKPAQKVKATIAIPIHAVGPVNKLMVRRGDAPVLRYDLRGKVKPLTGAFAANEGVDILKEGQAAVGATFPLGKFDWTVEGVEMVDGPVGSYKAPTGEKMFVVTVRAANSGLVKLPLSWNTLQPTLKDADGELLEWKQDFLGMNSNKTIGVEVDPNDSMRGKFVFSGVPTAKPARLTLLDRGTGRSVVVKFP